MQFFDILSFLDLKFFIEQFSASMVFVLNSFASTHPRGFFKSPKGIRAHAMVQSFHAFCVLLRPSVYFMVCWAWAGHLLKESMCNTEATRVSCQHKHFSLLRSQKKKRLWSDFANKYIQWELYFLFCKLLFDLNESYFMTDWISLYLLDV